MEELSEFFKLLSEEKKKKKEEFNSLIGDLQLDSLFEEVSSIKKKSKEKKKKEQKTLQAFEEFLYSDPKEKIKEEKVKNVKREKIEPEPELEPETEVKEPEIKEQVIAEGLLNIPPNESNKDPLTPLDQNFVTLEELNKHYKLFLNRIQQQLSTLGGGGETNLAYMDMPVTYITSSSYTVKIQDYYIGINYSGAVNVTLPTPRKNGKVYIIKDELGEASRGNNRHITIFPSGSDKIDGQDKVILAYDFGSLTFVYRNGWRVV